MDVYFCENKVYSVLLENIACCKGYPPIVDLRYREEDNISHSTRVLAAIES